MKADTFINAGLLLYGDGFHRRLADKLGVQLWAVHSWCNGRDEIPDSVEHGVGDLLAQKMAEISKLLGEIRLPKVNA